MNPELAQANVTSRLPRAVVGLAAAAVLLTGCSAETTGATPVKTVTETAAPSEERVENGTTDNDQPSPSALPSAEARTDEPDDDQGNPDQNSGNTRRHRAPAASQTPKPRAQASTAAPMPKPQQALVFRVTGDCLSDGELQNWSTNFTAYGSTYNEITEPDGTSFTPAEGLRNNGYGNVDGQMHSQWGWKCEPQDQLGEYHGTITDLGPDHKLGTADDRKVSYSFVVDQ